jgi:GxxExxY protein
MTKKEVTQLSYEITGLAIKVHKEIGSGLMESVYEKCLKFELEHNGYHVRQQLKIPLVYKKIKLETDFRLDLLVNDTIVIEIKSIEHVLPIHQAQLLTYMKLLKKPQGLLINFFTDNISKSLIPLVNEYYKELPN